MLKYILKRIALLFVTLWFILSLTYIGMLLMPGEPYANAQKMTDDQIQQLDIENGFDRPIIVQYVDYMTDVFLGENFPSEVEPFALDFGRSFQTNQEVKKDILRKYPVSFTIGIVSVIVGTIIGVLLGMLAALKKNSIADYFATFVAVIGVSFPSFVIAAYLQYYLAVELRLFPSSYSSSNPMSFILPVAALSVFAIATVARVTRTEMVEISSSNYINLARAKGVKNSKVISKHSFRNALVSILTVLGPLTVSLVTGSLVIEKIFSIPGIGSLLTDAVLTKDIYVVCGATFFIALQILLMYLLVDILYVLVDPRIKVSGGSNG